MSSNLILDLDARPPHLEEGYSTPPDYQLTRATGIFQFDPTRVELWLSAEQKGSAGTIKGVELYRQLAGRNNMAVVFLEWLEAAQDNPTVAEFLKPLEGQVLFAWGTVILFRGQLYVRHLSYWKNRWSIGTHPIGFNWSAENPALLRR